MSTAALTLRRIQTHMRVRWHPRTRARFPVENVLVFALALAFYIFIANYVVLHLHYLINDAYARIDNSFDVLFTRDPHLAAIGFVWPPLPSFVILPILAFKGVWPALANQGFAGSIAASIFSAGTVVLFNSGLKWAGVVRGMRFIFCAVWLLNPMTIIYAVQGMSEAFFIFFVVASILVFVAWCESRRGALLPLLGLLAGLGCLCRNEMFLLTFFLGAGVVFRAIRWRVSWREVETQALMFALPALLMIMLWIGSMAVIERDPLFWIHAQSAGSHFTAPIAQGAAAANAAAGGGELSGWVAAARQIIDRSLLLFPAALGALAILAVRVFLKKDRLTGLILLSFAIPVGALDVYLLHGGALTSSLRYQIYVIPFTFVVCVYVLRSLRSKTGLLSTVAALGMVLLLSLSNIATGMALGDSSLAPDEAPLVEAIATGKTMEQVTGGTAVDQGMLLAPRVEALDTDHGLIACDSTTCFPIILNVKDPKMFVVTSDRDFQAVLAQPLVYHVEYFLVQNSGRDELNVTYPGLWEDGAGFSVRVGDVGGGWRLYRITGPTGRG